MKKLLYLLFAVAALAMSSCTGSASVEKIIEKPDEEVTTEDVKVLVDYINKLVDSSESAVEACKEGNNEELQKWADSHKSELEIAGNVFKKMDSLPKEKLEGTGAQEASEKLLGLAIVMGMAGVK